jgi:hypothetical protein
LDSLATKLGEDKSQDLRSEIRFAWDENYLYFYAETADESLIARKTGRSIWMDDVLEMFIDPQGDGMYWGDASDLQLGFSIKADNTVATWAWFQGEDPSVDREVIAQGYAHQTGTLIEGAISWNYLGIRPEAGMVLNVSPAIHDLDKDRSDEKVEWFFRNEEKWKRFQLGKVILEGEAHAETRPPA